MVPNGLHELYFIQLCIVFYILHSAPAWSVPMLDVECLIFEAQSSVLTWKQKSVEKKNNIKWTSYVPLAVRIQHIFFFFVGEKKRKERGRVEMLSVSFQLHVCHYRKWALKVNFVMWFHEWWQMRALIRFSIFETRFLCACFPLILLGIYWNMSGSCSRWKSF